MLVGFTNDDLRFTTSRVDLTFLRYSSFDVQYLKF